jgi:dTDP-4-amino-4,6-dideoxygalactose transaminase
LIEDAAHAIESAWHGKKVGTTADLSCFSFYVTKNMTTGEGGMITTAKKQWADALKIHALHGMSQDAWKRFSDDGYKHYEVVTAGFKYNMTDLAASLGLHQLRNLDPWLQRRAAIWNAYDQAFGNLPCELPAAPEPGTIHARHLYTLLIDNDRSPIPRDRFMGELHKRGIGSGCHYQALHLHKFYSERLGVRRGDFPNAERISDRTASLPLSPKMTDGDVTFVIENVRAVLGG